MFRNPFGSIAQQIIPKREKRILIHILVNQPAPLSIFGQIKVAIKKKLTFGEARNKQLDEMLSDEHKQKSKAEKRIERTVVIAMASSALTVVGRLYFLPLQILGAIGLFYIGIPVYRKAFRELKQGKVSVSTLLTIIVLGAISFGFLAVGGFAIIVRQLSLKMRLKVTEDSKNKLIDVFRQHPDFVWLLVDGVEVQVPFDAVKVGDMVVVNAGEMIPIDGTIIEGDASVDQHILSGESTLAEKGRRDQVFASTTVLSGRICVEVEKAGEETTVAKIGDILNKTREFKTTTQLRAETLADRTIVPTLIMGGISLPILGPMGALAVLNSHFKYKMNVVAPISIMNFLNIASQNGILIKDGRTLDLLNQVDTIVFDKTGTLTEEQPSVAAIHVCADINENELLSYTAAAEYKQTHPIARAILQEAEKRGLNLPQIDEAEYKLGYGLTVSIEDKLVRVGSHRFMEISGISIPSEIKQIQAHCHEQAHSLVMVAIDEQLVGAIELQPTVRQEAERVINTLRKRGNIKEMYIISGDHTTPTKKLAEKLAIDHYFAETLPQDKASLIETLQQEGKFICYVGDGINDAIALKKSQVSISLRGASTVATDTAQIVLMDGKLDHLVSIFDLAQEFQGNINVVFAAVTLPAVISLGGVLFFHAGLAYTILLNAAGLVGGIANSMWPLLNSQSIQKRLSTGEDAY